MIRAQAPKAESAVMTIAEQLRKEGHKAGHEEGHKAGLEAGVLAGERRILRGLLEKRFGPLDDAQIIRLEQLDQAAIDFAVDRVLTADSVDAVLG